MLLKKASESSGREISELKQTRDGLRLSEAQKAEEIKGLQKSVDEQTEELSTLKSKNKSNASVISELNRSRNSLDATHTEKVAEIKRLASVNHSQFVELSQLKQINEKQRQEIAEKADEIQRLRKWRLLI